MISVELLTVAVLSALSLMCHATITTVPLIPHHVQRERHLKMTNDGEVEKTPSAFRRRDQAQQIGAMYHGYGTHYMDLWCGTPPQRQTVIVDTGSGVTAFPCSQCNDCGAPEYHTDNYFMEAESSTFAPASCSACRRGSCSGNSEHCLLSMSYAEGSSWHAYEAVDNCYVGGPHNVALTFDNKGTDDLDPGHASAFAFPMMFGCQSSLTGLFKSQLADGIMGMENNKNAFWKQMFDSGKMGDDQQFSLCFSRPPQVEREGTEAGAMTLGGSDPRLRTTDMVFTSDTSGSGRSGFFSVQVRAIYLRDGGTGGDSAKSLDPNAKIINLDLSQSILSRGGIIVDSGTTDTYWNKAISSAFRAAYKEMSGKTYSNKQQSLTALELVSLPTILFQIAGDETMNKELFSDPNSVTGLAGDLDPEHPYDVILALPPTHYMEGDENGKYTARFYDTEGGGSVLGANSMMGHDILFDVDNNRIGWAESDCDYKKLVTDNGYTDVLEFSAADEAKEVEEEAQVEEDEKQSEIEEEEEEAEQESETVEEEEEEEEQEPSETEEEAEEESEEEEEEFENEEESESEEVEVVVPADKKKAPASDSNAYYSDAHDSQSPSDDVKKTIQGYADSCDSIICRGGALGIVFLILIFGYCFCRCCCCRASKRPNPASYHKAEVEMSNGGFSSFKDSGGYADDDAEYGEFSSNGKAIS